MDNFSEVWHRVQQSPQENGDGIPALIARNLTNAEIFRRLSGSHSGACGQALRDLSLTALNHAHCLSGIYRLIYEKPSGAKPYKIPEEPENVTLRRCYGEQLRLHFLYKAHYTDPQFGGVYRILLEEGENCCRLLLMVIGTV